jgi:hypothetical protein
LLRKIYTAKNGVRSTVDMATTDAKDKLISELAPGYGWPTSRLKVACPDFAHLAPLYAKQVIQKSRVERALPKSRSAFQAEQTAFIDLVRP